MQNNEKDAKGIDGESDIAGGGRENKI